MSNVKLTNNFLANARGLTFADGGGLTWSFDANGNVLSATVTGSGGVTSITSTTLTIGGTSSVPTIDLSTTQVTNIGKGGTALQTASVIDSITGTGVVASPLQLSGDAATPGNSMYYGTNGSGTKGFFALPAGANPTAAVGTSAVTGTSASFMRADAAPAINLTMTPTWTGLHTFNGKIAVGDAGTNLWATFNSTAASGGFIQFNRSGVAKWYLGDATQTDGGTLDDAVLQAVNSLGLSAGNVRRITIASTGEVTIKGKAGINNATPPAQVTGWGTPTGPAVVASFSGTAATTLQMQNAIAKIITDLKAFGLYGA